jgi:hypothetical protein
MAENNVIGNNDSMSDMFNNISHRETHTKFNQVRAKSPSLKSSDVGGKRKSRKLTFKKLAKKHNKRKSHKQRRKSHKSKKSRRSRRR